MHSLPLQEINLIRTGTNGFILHAFHPFSFRFHNKMEENEQKIKPANNGYKQAVLFGGYRNMRYIAAQCSKFSWSSSAIYLRDAKRPLTVQEFLQKHQQNLSTHADLQ